MKICVAQTRPVKGDITGNITNHITLINLAVANGAETIVFPELSITGYEPTLSKELAAEKDEQRFDVFQKISDANKITIGVGVPIKNDAGISISMLLFQSDKTRQLYSKKFLHADEEPFFISAQSTVGLLGDKNNIALAICYEILVSEHFEDAFKNGAEIYIASVAKSLSGINKALDRLAFIARQHSVTVFMSNCIGESDGFECAGKTSVWNNKGLLAGQLNDTNEGILIFDTNTQELIEKTI